jgi:hypothetical protein
MVSCIAGITEASTTAFFVDRDGDLANFLFQVALNHDPDFCLLGIWDYKSDPLHLTLKYNSFPL